MDITVTHDRGMRFVAQCGSQTVTMGKADGDDEAEQGLSPGQLFIAALGGCIAGYVVQFCERHDLHYEGLTVRLQYENAESPSRVAGVHAIIRLPAAVPPKYRSAILRVAEQCYVTQSIRHNMPVDISVVDSVDESEARLDVAAALSNYQS